MNSYINSRRACRFCGLIAHGPGCIYSYNSYHVETGDPNYCIYCGSTAYGVGCTYSLEDDRKHKHGHGDKKCIWCGAVISHAGPGCAISPNGRHEL